MYRYVQLCTLLLLLSILLAACNGHTPSTAPVDNLTQETVTPTKPGSTDTPEPQPTPVTVEPGPNQQSETIPLPNNQYTLTAVLNYGNHLLTVDEQVQYVNHSRESLSDMVLMVEPDYYPGVFHLKNIAWEDGQVVEGLSTELGQIHFPLRQPLSPGDSLNFSISYQLQLPSPMVSPETRPVPFGYTDRQTNLVDWYPFVPPYSPDQGWVAHKAGYFGEHLVYDIADFSVEINISDNRSDLTIAASAPAETEDGWHRYRLEDARNFAWSVSHDYQVTTTNVDGVEILNYAFHVHPEAAERVLQTTAQALTIYSQLYGPYPREQLSVVEADFLDGMEYEGLYFLSNGFYNLYQGNPGEYLVAIAAHETAHQWFYGLVGNDQAYEPWLDEALCTYNERLYYEQLYPEALDWWWTYRINYYEPSGWVDGSIYNPDGYQAYRNAIYLNGAVFLEELRTLIGDQAFFAFLKEYVNNNRNQRTTADDFFTLLAQHSQEDISVLLNKYFEHR